jgi:hypothetical protein
MVSAKQTTLKKFDLSFDSAMTKDDVTKNLVVYYVLGGTKVKESVKGVSMSADNKVATVEMNYEFTKGTTYVVEYPNMKSVEFVSATAKVEDVVDMAIKTTTAQEGKETKLDIALLNKDGVNIANDDLLGRITTEKSDNNYAYLVTPLKLQMYKLGESVKITSTFHTYNWKDGKEIGNVSATAQVTCVEVAKDVAGSIYAWTLKSSAPTNFTTPKTQIFKGDTATNLYVVLKGKDANGDDLYTSNFTYTGSPSTTPGTLGWKFTSSNPDVLFASNSGSLGSVYGVKEGTATVVVSYNDVQVGACEITVAGTRKAAMASLSTQTLTLSNAINEALSVSYEVKDQFGEKYLNGSDDYKVTAVANPNSTYTNGPDITYSTVNDTISFNARINPLNPVSAGTYNYTVKLTDDLDDKNVISLSFSVVVKAPTNTNISYYKIEADKPSYDVKSETTMSTAYVQLSAYAYNTEGIKISKLANVSDLEALNSNVQVKMAGTVTEEAIIGATDRINLVTTKSVSGKVGVISTLDTGAWLITGTTTNTPGNPATDKKAVYAAGFEVKNSQAKAVYSVKNTYTDKYDTFANLADVINECVSFAAGDTKLTVDNDSLNTTNTYIADKRVTLKKIKLYDQLSDGKYVEYEVNLNDLVLRIK